MLRQGLSDHDLMRDAMAYAEGMLLIEQCLNTVKDPLKASIQAIVDQMRPPPQTPLNVGNLPPIFD